MSVKLVSVEEQYNKDKNLKKDDIKYLQSWLEKQPHLPSISELELICFLHSCFYSIEKTKETIDSYFTVKTVAPELFGKKDPSKFKLTLDENIYYPLPILTTEGYLVFFVKCINCNPNTYDFGSHVKYLYTVAQIWLLEHGLVNGVLLLVDMEGLTLTHITKIPISSLKKCMIFLQEALPIRLKGIYVINTVSFLDKLLAFVKPFLKKEIVHMLNVYTKDSKEVYKYIPLECFPNDYGGTVGSITDLQKLMKNKVLSNCDFIREQENRLVNEEKRQDKARSPNVLFGIEGSFKKLEID